jgi:hypothetical protein
VVVDAVGYEPVSSFEFPGSREFSREFFEKGLANHILASENGGDIKALAANSLLDRSREFFC